MSVLKFTDLSSKARMLAVISFREHIERELDHASKVLDEARQMTYLPDDQQPADLQEMMTRACKVRNAMLTNAGRMEDDLFCIEHLQQNKLSFTDEGSYLSF